MGEMANRMAAQIAEDGGLGESDGDGAAAAPGTGNGGTPTTPAEAENTVTEGRQGPPESIPYSRFQEVNSRYQELKDYEELVNLGIEPDSAVRLANFEAAFVQDPKGIIGTLIDSQPDLTDEAKSAMKTLLSQTSRAGAQGEGEEDEDGAALPKEVQERLAYVDQLRAEREQADSQARLDVVVRHWDGLDKQDNLEVPERTKLVWIQSAAGAGGFETLEQLAEAARTAYLADRDATLGSVVQSRGTGAPRTVPGGAAVPTPPTEFKGFKEANRQILADIREGRLPGMEMES